MTRPYVLVDRLLEIISASPKAKFTQQELHSLLPQGNTHTEGSVYFALKTLCKEACIRVDKTGRNKTHWRYFALVTGTGVVVTERRARTKRKARMRASASPVINKEKPTIATLEAYVVVRLKHESVRLDLSEAIALHESLGEVLAEIPRVNAR